MKVNKILKFIIFAAMLVLCCIILPLSANASPYTEGQDAVSGDGLYYINPDDENDHWVVVNEKWHKCIVDDSDNFDSVEAKLCRAMVDRKNSATFYIATKNKNNRNLTTQQLFEKCDSLSKNVYKQSEAPNKGDYLRMMSTTNAANVGVINASYYNDDYTYYYLNFSISNMTTDQQEKMIESFLGKWNDIYIKSNKTIQSASGDRKEYLIVKTIYNYIVSNTTYDYDVYRDLNNTKFPVDSARYKYSHSAYGALFGNLQESYSNSFDIDSVNISYKLDSQGLNCIDVKNQGMSVCDGYSLVIYYLCKLNGIDAKIVKGDNAGATLTKPIDPHAWNLVYLHDSDDSSYEWYQIDATFAKQNSRVYGSDIFAVDYSYFLRGTDSKAFSVSSHQQIYDEFKKIAVKSEDDYKIAADTIDLNNTYAIITRSRDAAESNLEDYVILFPNGNYYKTNLNGDYERCSNFVYNGRGYYYNITILDLAQGIECQSPQLYIKDHGDYSLTVKDIYNSKSVFNHILTIECLDMSDWSNYNTHLTARQTSSYFNGAYVDIIAEIYDISNTKLIEGKDYNIKCYSQSDTAKKNSIKPYNPGKYNVYIEYKGNYCNSLAYVFEVKKGKLSFFQMSDVSVRFGTDLNNSCNSLNLGSTPISKGVDYSVKVIGGLNYGDEGIIRITGLSSSKYVSAADYTDRKYKISSRYDVSKLFDGKSISNPTYMYTGKQIKPDDFVLSYQSNGKKITLEKGKDYVIDSYKNNIKSGTGFVIVKFKGNYSGKAQMTFNIKCIEFEVKIPDLKYNGKKQKPSPVVKFGGHTLTNGKDYTFASTATNPGIYLCKIKGKGSYSKFSINKYYFVKPSKVSSLKAKPAENSVKLTWKKQGKNCYYEIYAYDSVKKKWKSIGITNSASYTVTSVYKNNKAVAVKPNTEYKFRVRACFTASINKKTYTKYGEYADVVIRTLPKTPAFTRVKKGKSTLKFTWEKNSSVNGYEIVIASDSKYKKDVQEKVLTKNSSTSHTFKKIKKGKTYYAKIRAYKTINGKKVYSSYSKSFKIKM